MIGPVLCQPIGEKITQAVAVGPHLPDLDLACLALLQDVVDHSRVAERLLRGGSVLVVPDWRRHRIERRIGSHVSYPVAIDAGHFCGHSAAIVAPYLGCG